MFDYSLKLVLHTAFLWRLTAFSRCYFDVYSAIYVLLTVRIVLWHFGGQKQFKKGYKKCLKLMASLKKKKKAMNLVCPFYKLFLFSHVFLFFAFFLIEKTRGGKKLKKKCNP